MHKTYKNLFGALLLSGVATTAGFAGGLSDPEVTPEIIIQETVKSSSDDWVVPFMTLLLLATAAATN